MTARPSRRTRTARQSSPTSELAAACQLLAQNQRELTTIVVSQGAMWERLTALARAARVFGDGSQEGRVLAALTFFDALTDSLATVETGR